MPSQATSADVVALLAGLNGSLPVRGRLKPIPWMNTLIDLRSILPSVRVPTLVLHRRTDALIPIELGCDIAAQISGAKFIEYPDGDHAFWTGDVETMTGNIEEFVTGHRDGSVDTLERALATVLFTNIVDSTRSAAELGDRTWRRLLDNHDQIAKQTIEKHRGTLIKSTGDGILATFDGPGRAVRCAIAFEAASKQIGIPLRAGLHTGEIEMRGCDVSAIAVHAAARVTAQAGSREILVSRVITELVAGAGLKFSNADRMNSRAFLVAGTRLRRAYSFEQWLLLAEASARSVATIRPKPG
jgi:class 3 adenylate cyclase